MMFEWIADPTAWLGLLTLIVLEIVLGIDNLVFIAILADKLPPHLRDRARLIGLSLALLMRLGALAAIGYRAPANLLHVLLDNALHESTGGQSTVSQALHFGQIALACGYRQRHVLNEPDQLAALVARPTGELTFVRAAILPGVAQPLPRPAVSPAQVTERLRRYIAAQEKSR